MEFMKKHKYASNTFNKWEDIDWKLVEKKVRNMQERIVQAKKNGKNRKAKTLQWLLTNSYYAKLLAVKRVTSNKGKRTPGVDGKTWTGNIIKMKEAKALKNKGYKPLPLRRIYIPKANGKKRPLSIPSMKDRAMQALHLMALNPMAETMADTNSYGFRPKRACADAIEQCFNIFARKDAAQWVLEADIEACFDNINHQWLIENIPMNKNILTKWLKAGFIENNRKFPTGKGTPQGGIISPILANLTLDGLEDKINKACEVRKTKTSKKTYLNKRQVNFVRYADDFLISARDQYTLKQIVLPTVIQFLEERGLNIQKAKTKITNINQGVDFLGQNIRKYKGKLLIKPSKKSCHKLMLKVNKIIKKSGSMPAHKLIHRLNPVIRGWANYHRHIVAKQTFSILDNRIFHALWQWAKRRHNNKNAQWRKNKYFKVVEKQNWVFTAMDDNKNVRLFKMESIPIKRFVKIRRGANPFDKKWESYFDKRKCCRVR